MSPGRAIRVVIISGLSGSGKSTAIRALEDIGFFCIDNLPVVLLPKLIELFPSRPEEIEQIALVIDARESRFLTDFGTVIERVRFEVGRVEVIFLDCADEALLRRYSETRRRHPLSPDGSVEEGVRIERGLLDVLRRSADRVIDTSELNPHELRQQIQAAFTGTDVVGRMNLALVSFGFKYGLPNMCDLVFDVRFLPNPYFVPEFRDQPGTDPAVSAFVLESPESQALLDVLERFLVTFRPLYEREGKSALTVGIGCTGGRHRSVAIAEELGRRLRAVAEGVSVRHRDVGRA